MVFIPLFPSLLYPPSLSVLPLRGFSKKRNYIKRSTPLTPLTGNSRVVLPCPNRSYTNGSLRQKTPSKIRAKVAAPKPPPRVLSTNPYLARCSTSFLASQQGRPTRVSICTYALMGGKCPVHRIAWSMHHNKAPRRGTPLSKPMFY